MSGISAAGSVPFVLSYEGERKDFDNTLDVKLKQVSAFENISRCVDNSGSEISFGEQSVDRVCGLVEGDEERASSRVKEDQKYTQLFQRMGNDQRGIGSSGSEHGKTYCDKHKGMFSSHVAGGESLGICDNEGNQNQGIMVQNKDNTSIEVCSGSCFEEKTTHPGKTLNSFERKGVGKSIKFRKLV